MRTQLLIKIWKRHFRNADADEFNRQFDNNTKHKSLKKTPRARPVHRIPERNQITELICTPINELISLRRTVHAIIYQHQGLDQIAGSTRKPSSRRANIFIEATDDTKPPEDKIKKDISRKMETDLMPFLYRE
jgi:hypothetical protein